MRYEEAMIQKIVVNWLRNKHPEIIFTCAPAVAKSPRQGRENKLMGYQKGIPDLMIFIPKKGYAGLFIELKTPTGKIQPEQEKIIDGLVTLGYRATICRSPDEAIRTIQEYLK